MEGFSNKPLSKRQAITDLLKDIGGYPTFCGLPTFIKCLYNYYKYI